MMEKGCKEAYHIYIYLIFKLETEEIPMQKIQYYLGNSNEFLNLFPSYHKEQI